MCNINLWLANTGRLEPMEMLLLWCTSFIPLWTSKQTAWGKLSGMITILIDLRCLECESVMCVALMIRSEYMVTWCWDWFLWAANPLALRLSMRLMQLTFFKTLFALSPHIHFLTHRKIAEQRGTVNIKLILSS